MNRTPIIIDPANVPRLSSLTNQEWQHLVRQARPDLDAAAVVAAARNGLALRYVRTGASTRA